MNAQWLPDKNYDLDGLRVAISKPVAVGRRSECFWYPNIMRFADGTLTMSIRVGDDRLTADDALLTWSKDGGLTWSEPQRYAGQSFSYLPLASDEIALLPHHLYRSENGCTGLINVIDAQGRIKRIENGVSVVDLPRPFGGDLGNPADDAATVAKAGRIPLSFNGTPFRAKDGSFLTILYGVFSGAKRYSALIAESLDGLQWRIRATIADENCKLAGSEGPCEACLCRLPDGHLMCIFRRGWETYGQCWSADDGKTWSEPVAMKAEGKVEPKLLVQPDGTLVLAGGRNGLYLWFDRSGKGKTWQVVDTVEHHNSLLPQEPITVHAPQNSGGTTSYTGIVAVDADTFLYVYDRVPVGFKVREEWHPKNPDDVLETFGVFIARVTVSR